MELKDPKRKRSNAGQIAAALNQQPLPVLIESISGIAASNTFWPVYIGTFNGESVVISSQDEITSLYNMGNFGKGCFSRSYPNFGKTKRGIPPLIRERQWKRRKLWMEQLLSFTEASCSQGLKAKVDASKSNKADEKSSKKDSDKNSDPNIISLDGDEVEIIDAEMDEGVDGSSREKAREREVASVSTRNECISLDDDDVCSESKNVVQEINIIEDSIESDKASDKAGKLPNAESRPAVLTVLSGSSNEQEGSSHTPFLDRVAGIPDNVIVINDENDDDESLLKSPEPRLCDEPIKTIVETLNLSMEEAFFLSFGLGCLQVINLQGVFLTLTGMWQAYRDSKAGFITSYVAYHYFRSKGWVVKPGAKFGGDFLLYKQGPSFYHASYIVLIEEVNDSVNGQTKTQKPVMWTKLLALNRIAENAAKEILLCHVKWPLDITTEDLKSPKVISKFKVQEVLFRRWISTSNRDEKED